MEWLETGKPSDPAALLLHGSPGHFSMLAQLAETLASEGFFVLAPNLPGYGASASLPESTTHDAALAALTAELLGRGQTAVSIFGFSLGAYLALSLAIAKPFRVRQVFTVGAYADHSARERAGLAEFAADLRRGVDPRTPEFRAMFIARMLSPAFAEAHPDSAERIADWLDLAPPAVVADDLEAISVSRNLLPQLHALDAPLVLRVGELDVATPVALSQAIADRVPGAELQVVAGAGHCLLSEDRDGTLAAIVSAWTTPSS